MGNINKNLTKEKETKEMETEVKDQDQVVETEAEATEVVKPEDTTVEDAPVKRSKKEAFNKWKAKHPKLTKAARKVGIVAAIVGAGMLGKSVGEKLQEQKDANLLQDAIDNGDLVRANDEMLAEANDMLKKNIDESADI
jgi:hypothetical protein